MSAPDFADFARPRKPFDPDGTTGFADFADFAHVAYKTEVPACKARLLQSQPRDAQTSRARQDLKHATRIAHPTAGHSMAVGVRPDADGYLLPSHGFSTRCSKGSRPRRAEKLAGEFSRALRHRPSRRMRPVEFHWLHGERDSQSRNTSVCGHDDPAFVPKNPRS